MQNEALITAQQIQTAQLLPAGVSAWLTGELVCYVWSVIGSEWDRMQSGSLGQDINPWGVAMFKTLRDVDLYSPNEEAAYGKWLDQTSDPRQVGQDRIHGATGLDARSALDRSVLHLRDRCSALVFGFADSGERGRGARHVHGQRRRGDPTLLLLLRFLSNPYQGSVGALQPTAMERTVLLIDEQLQAVGADVRIPCDAVGVVTCSDRDDGRAERHSGRTRAAESNGGRAQASGA